MDKEKRLAAARKKLQEYKKARGESGGSVIVPGGKESGEVVPVISGNSSSSGSDSSMIIINPQYILENSGSNFASAVPSTQESDLEILATPTPSPSLLHDDSKVASQQQSSASSSFADEHSSGNNVLTLNENTGEGEETSFPGGTTYGAPHSTTSSVPDSDNEQFVFLNPPPGQQLHEIPLYSPQVVSSTGIQLPQLYPPSFGLGTSEATDSLEMHTFTHNYQPLQQQGQVYSSSSFTPPPVSGSERYPPTNQEPGGIPMHPVPLNQNGNEQSLIQVPPQPIFIDPNPKVNPPPTYVSNTSSSPPLPSSSESQNVQPVYMPYFQESPSNPQNVISDPLTVNNPYFYPQEEASSIILHPATPQVQFADVHPQVNSRPSSRRSNRSQQEGDENKDEKDHNIVELQRMQSVQDALELQMEELSRDNTRLLNRQSELLAQLEENERVLHDLRRERDHAKDDAKKSLQPMHVKINTLYEENQRILKSSSDQYNEMMGKLEEKTKQFLEMEQAFIVVSQSKMEFAAQLDQEKERLKESELAINYKDEEIQALRETNAKLEERLKIELQKEAVNNQLEDQRRHFQVQAETFYGELERAEERIKVLEKESVHHVQQNQAVQMTSHTHDHGHTDHHHEHHHPAESASEEHHHSETCGHDHEHAGGDHGEEHDHHHHDHDDHHGHSHSHDDHGHGHSHSHDDDRHGHSHSHEDHGHGHSHSHDDHHHDAEPSIASNRSKKPLSLQEELTELKKTLLRMEWENTTYRTELDRLAIDAKAKQAYENNYNLLKADSDKMKEEIERLEHLVIQLQGENDTIGDYISLYQSQRLALRERAKEKDAQIENLAKEREVLLSKMAELNELLKELKIPHSLNIRGTETDSSLHHHHHHNLENMNMNVNPMQQQQIEGKIINLISEISSSSLIENFHPCAVCSGRLMTV